MIAENDETLKYCNTSNREVEDYCVTKKDFRQLQNKMFDSIIINQYIIKKLYNYVSNICMRLK